MTMYQGQESIGNSDVVVQLRTSGFKSILHNKKVTAIAVLVGANIFNNLVVFLINIIVARRFGPDIFGIFSLAASYMISINLIVDLGINITVIRFYNLYSGNRAQQDRLLLSLFLWKLSIVFMLILLSIPLGFFATQLFRLSEAYFMLFTLSAGSAGIFGLWLYFQSFLQAHKQFKKLAVFVILGAFMRLVCFIALYVWMLSSMNLVFTFASIYTIPLLIAIGVGVFPLFGWFMRHGFPRLGGIWKDLAKITRYGKWVALSGLCHSLIYRGVQFILATRTTNFELGIFSAGFVFTLAFAPFNTAVRTVFFPHVTAYKTKAEMTRHLSRMKRIFPFYVIFVVVGISCLVIVQLAFLGNEYATALPVFLITSFALTLTIFLGLASMLVHTLMHPEIDAYTNIGRLIIASIGTYFLAPVFGAVGGALCYAFPLIIGEIAMVLYVRKLIARYE